VHRLLRHVTGQVEAAPVRVGILGYGAIGHEHNAAIAQTPGLELVAVCDPNPLRVAAAQELAPSVRGHATAEDLLADDGVDLVIVSTPPDTHAAWALRFLEAGKSVVVEKPFCITVEEADRQIAAARERGLMLAVYQNRRWDPDYLALKQVVRSGALGDVFHYESFIGGYGHPCNYWHSDEAVSGGAIYDWGSHYLDWVLDLFDQEVEWVSATTHKRVWHDVTNADHTRVLVHFTDGVEAEFTHSDLAAAIKPKFYVLGTRGGLVGDWRTERVVARSPIGTLQEDRLAVSDSPADLRVFTPDGAGGTSETRLSIPPAPDQPFHRQLADALLSGEPMDVTPEGSRRNIAVMQAATLSARDGGRPVPLPG
jgi:predicted dehydrogenase